MGNKSSRKQNKVDAGPQDIKVSLPASSSSVRSFGNEVFCPAEAKGGDRFVARSTALIMIEYQNEFTSEGGHLYDAVKENMQSTNMLANSVAACKRARELGCKIIHVPIYYCSDMSNNPNKRLGILKGINEHNHFVENTWNSAFYPPMNPKQGDLICHGKRGLDSFPGTNLEALLIEHKIETVAIGGFLTNCCVESTMRTAYEKGFNVVTLTDCTATTSSQGFDAAVNGTFGMFSAPMDSQTFLTQLSGRVFSPGTSKGGQDHIESDKTALIMIEFQNEFTTEGGKLHDGVKGNMQTTNMLQNSVQVCAAARAKGAKIIHVGIQFKEDMSDNPNKGIGILHGCNEGKLFIEGTWNSAFCEAMTPQHGDLICIGKRGLDAFPGTNLEDLLTENGIENVAIGGFLTNCCVESTMRTAYEKGFNVFTLTDCTATTSEDGYQGAVNGTFGMFSTPLTGKAFVSKLDVVPGRVFSASDAKGGKPFVANSTALIMIEYQNEFTTEGGKLHESVKPVMESTNMLANSVQVCAAARARGAKIIHCGIEFKEDMSDNPNKGIGILKGCAEGGLFVSGTWNAAFCDEMKPQEGDIVCHGKKGLDAFPGSELEDILVREGIESVALGGFLTNCCVESTMRTAFEKGFNVATLTDCTATNSQEGYEAAVNGTFGMFSAPMTSEAFLKALQ